MLIPDTPLVPEPIPVTVIVLLLLQLLNYGIVYQLVSANPYLLSLLRKVRSIFCLIAIYTAVLLKVSL